MSRKINQLLVKIKVYELVHFDKYYVYERFQASCDIFVVPYELYTRTQLDGYYDNKAIQQHCKRDTNRSPDDTSQSNWSTLTFKNSSSVPVEKVTFLIPKVANIA